MESDNSSIAQIATAVQLAIAPIFLLVGTGSILAVMTLRLGRVIDRVRKLEDLMDEGETGIIRERHMHELQILDQRMSYANRAIAFNSGSAVMVCLMIALLFLGEITGLAVSVAISVLFIVTMLMLITGLSFFLVEIYVAYRSLRVRSELLVQESSQD